MESIDSVWLFGGLALAGGILLGVLLLRLLNPAAGDVAKLQAELEQARSEMESYKASVNSHFNKTSDLVNELTQDYVKVYRHLAEGAQTLSETREFTQVLDQPQGRVLITVETEADQPSTPDEKNAPGVGSDTIATESVAVVDDSPVGYVGASEAGAVSEVTLGAETESVEESVRDDDEKAAAVSTDEMTAREDDRLSAIDAERQAVADAVDAYQQAVADERETDSTKTT